MVDICLFFPNPVNFDASLISLIAEVVLIFHGMTLEPHHEKTCLRGLV